MQFGRHAGRHQALGIGDVLIQEYVEGAHADEGRRQAGQSLRPRCGGIGRDAVASRFLPNSDRQPK
jgi:hypothetical protein